MIDVKILSYDDCVDVFRMGILEKFSVSEIPSEKKEGYESFVVEKFERGEIKTMEDMYNVLREKIDEGGLPSVYFR
jgi:hypothetical protein